MNSHNSHMCQHEVNHNWNLFFFLISINKYGRTIFWMILPCIEKILKNFIFSQPGIGSLPNPSWYQHGFWAYCNFFVRNSWGILGVKQLQVSFSWKNKRLEKLLCGVWLWHRYSGSKGTDRIDTMEYIYLTLRGGLFVCFLFIYLLPITPHSIFITRYSLLKILQFLKSRDGTKIRSWGAKYKHKKVYENQN